MSKGKALIFGVTGQDGSYLAELLLEEGFTVHGVRRRVSTFNTGRIETLIQNPLLWEKRFHLHYGDVTDMSSLNSIISVVKPDLIFNLAAQSHVGLSFDLPVNSVDIAGLGCVRILESLRQMQKLSEIRFYQSSTSELFGGQDKLPLTESSQFNPRSPYALGKLLAYWNTRFFREAYGLHASNGILFNHESPRRGETFVTRKITRGLARIALGKADSLMLGNLYAQRDWGHAKDFVKSMYLMTNWDFGDDYVVATGIQHSVKDFVNYALDYLNISVSWEGEGIEERAIESSTGKVMIKVDPGYYRPLEVDNLLGNSDKIRKRLGWAPSYSFSQIVEEMIEYDLEDQSRRN
jgi:GDPmannose 4,6-dehydratase